MGTFPPRHAISRAQFFLALASKCESADQNEFEAFMEASIVFGRTAIHRLKNDFEHHTKSKNWFDSLKENPSIEFVREQRDFILKEGPSKVGQRIGVAPVVSAAELYFFDESGKPADQTVREHLEALTLVIEEANVQFAASK